MSPNLERDLLKYAMAGAGMIASTATGHASIVYSGALSTNIPLSPNPALGIAYSNSPITNFSLQRNAGFVSNSYSYGAFANLFLTTGTATGLANPISPSLTAGQLIDGGLTFGAPNMAGVISEAAAGFFDSPAPLVNLPAGQHYLGFRYTVSGQNYFGWALIDITDKTQIDNEPPSASLNANLLGYAFESCAATGINAGATSGGGSCDATGAPEPNTASLLMLTGGAATLAIWRRRRQLKS